MNILKKIALAAALAISLAPLVQANDAHHAAGAASAAPDLAAAAPSEGEVRKVNKDTGRLTIKHGELKNLGMPPMSMVFRVKDQAMLDQVKVGDKISFVADKVGGQFTVVKLEVQQ